MVVSLRIDRITPTRHKCVKHSAIGQVPSQIALQIKYADVYQHVHPSKASQLSDDRKRQIFKVVRVEKCEMQSRWVQCVNDFIDCDFRAVAMNFRGTTERPDPLLQRQRICFLKIVEVN